MLMQDVVYRRAAAHQAEDLKRLADRAEREGVIIYVEPVEGRHDATSRRDPTRLYRVSPSGCDCPGFTTWGRCGHAALLASQLGWIPDPIDAGPSAPVAVVLIPEEREDELARRRERAEEARNAWRTVPLIPGPPIGPLPRRMPHVAGAWPPGSVWCVVRGLAAGGRPRWPAPRSSRRGRAMMPTPPPAIRRNQCRESPAPCASGEPPELLHDGALPRPPCGRVGYRLARRRRRAGSDRMSIAEDITEKPRRGRPPLMSAGVETGYRQLWPGLSRRTLQARRYELHAAGVLWPDLGEMLADQGATLKNPFAFLWDIEADPDSTMKHVILGELGRVGDPEAITGLAAHICAARLPTAKAVALIRRYRLGDAQAAPERLADAILATINQHLTRYPQTTGADVLTALHDAADVASDAEARP